MMVKKDKIVMKTPRGRALWSHLKDPVTYKGVEPTPKDPGKYEIDVVLDPNDSEVTEFLQGLESYAIGALSDFPGADRHPKAFMPITEETRKNAAGDKEPTGNVVLKLRLKAGGVYAKSGDVWTESPCIFDHEGNLMELEQELGNGSVIRASFEPDMWVKEGLARVSFRLRTVKVLLAQYHEVREVDDKMDFAGEAEEVESFDF